MIVAVASIVVFAILIVEDAVIIAAPVKLVAFDVVTVRDVLIDVMQLM